MQPTLAGRACSSGLFLLAIAESFGTMVIDGTNQFTGRAMKRGAKTTRSRRRKRHHLNADRWKSLARLSDSELHATDVGLCNLACAAGLPYAESLNPCAHLDELDRLAKHVARELSRNKHNYQRERKRHGDSPAQWTAGMLVTVLQQDCGVHYNAQRIHDPDFSDSRDLFIHGMLGPDAVGGTCASMPFLYVAVGGRLGMPLYVASAKAHLFVRWDDPQGKRWRERDASWRHAARFNLEGASRGFHFYEDEYYHRWPIPMTRAEIGSGIYLKSMTRRQELACMLAARGHCLEDNGQLSEAVEVYRAASDLQPAYRFFLDGALKKAAQEMREAPHARAQRPIPR